MKTDLTYLTSQNKIKATAKTFNKYSKKHYMKKFLLAVGIMLLTVMSSATTKYKATLITQERINIAKTLIKKDTARLNGWLSIKAEADKQLKKGGLMKAEYMAVAYRMTEDARYADKLRDILLNAIKAKNWGNSEMQMRTPAWNSELNLAHKSFQLALAYDAVRDRLSASERKSITAGLMRLAVKPALEDWIAEPTRIHTLNTMGHNWWTSCVCMGGLLALSLQEDSQEARHYAETVNEVLPEWFDFAGDVIQGKPKTFDNAGGMYESLNYANFGIQEALLFRIAWKNINGASQMPDIPQLLKLPSYFIHVCYPRTGILYSINFGDSHKNVSADTSMMLLYAIGYHDSNILWYLAQNVQGQHRDGYFTNRPMGMLYLPDLTKAPMTPSLQKTQLFADFGWTTMRSSWKKDATMLAMKSGHTWNHSHADANSFILFHKGVDIIKDGGNCWYPKPEYRNYFFQSQAHNVVLFNSKGQPREQQYHGSLLNGNMSNLLAGERIKYVLANGTGPYSSLFSRNLRHFLWIDNVIYVIDDLKTHEIGHFEWLWHTNGITKKNGIDMNVTNGNAAITIRPLYPQTLAKSDFVHDYPDDLYWEEIEAPEEGLQKKETYYSFHLPAKTDRIKSLTAIIMKDNPDDMNLPTMERREGSNWIGLRISSKGKVTDLYINQLADGKLMHSNSWIYPDGWSTDAYMFAVTYDEGSDPAQSKDIFICYGSSLRRGSKSYFSSLSKLFVIFDSSNGGNALQASGQPKMRFTLNGRKININKKEKQ